MATTRLHSIVQTGSMDNQDIYFVLKHLSSIMRSCISQSNKTGKVIVMTTQHTLSLS